MTKLCSTQLSSNEYQFWFSQLKWNSKGLLSNPQFNNSQTVKAVFYWTYKKSLFLFVLFFLNGYLAVFHVFWIVSFSSFVYVYNIFFAFKCICFVYTHSPPIYELTFLVIWNAYSQPCKQNDMAKKWNEQKKKNNDIERDDIVCGESENEM